MTDSTSTPRHVEIAAEPEKHQRALQELLAETRGYGKRHLQPDTATGYGYKKAA